MAATSSSAYSWHQSPDYVPEFVDTPISPSGNAPFDDLLASLVDGTLASSFPPAPGKGGLGVIASEQQQQQLGMLVDLHEEDWMASLSCAFGHNDLPRPSFPASLPFSSMGVQQQQQHPLSSSSSSSSSSPSPSSSPLMVSPPLAAVSTATGAGQASSQKAKKEGGAVMGAVTITDGRTGHHDFSSSFEGFDEMERDDHEDQPLVRSVTTNGAAAAADTVSSKAFLPAGSKRASTATAARVSGKPASALKAMAAAAQQQQQQQSAAAAATAVHATRGATASAAKASTTTSSRPTRKAAERAVAAMEAATSPLSSVDGSLPHHRAQAHEESGSEFEDDEERTERHNAEEEQDDSDAEEDLRSRRTAGRRGGRASTTAAAASSTKSSARRSGASSVSGRESSTCGANDPNRNARLAKENRERKKRYIASLEDTIETLKAELAQRDALRASQEAKFEAERAELRAQMDLLRAQNSTLQTSLAHQTAFAPIIAALQQVPGLSFGAPAEEASSSSSSKRPRLATASTGTVVPLTFNVHLSS